MVKRREDSIKELKKRKTNEQLAAENAAMREKVATLEGQLTDTQMALCDVYEALVGGEQ